MVLLGANIKLASQDGLDAPGGCGFKKMHRAVDVAMVGYGHGLLTNAVDVGDQLFDITGAVKQRIVSVQMKVGELCHEDISSLVCRADRTGVQNRGGLRKRRMNRVSGRAVLPSPCHLAVREAGRFSSVECVRSS